MLGPWCPPWVVPGVPSALAKRLTWLLLELPGGSWALGPSATAKRPRLGRARHHLEVPLQLCSAALHLFGSQSENGRAELLAFDLCH